MNLLLPKGSSWLAAGISALAGSWFFLCVVTVVQVHDHSMAPTLPEGSYALLVRANNPERGEVYVLRLPENLYRRYPQLRKKHLGNQTLIKRVVALPGDIIHEPGSATHTLGRDEFWVQGDAQDSIDSRIFGPVQRTELVGHAFPLPILP